MNPSNQALVAHTYIDWSTCKQSLAIWLALHRAVPCLREGAPLLPLLTTPNMCCATAAMLRITQHHLPFSQCLRTGCNLSSTSVLATFLLLWLAACPSHKHMTGVVVHGTGTPQNTPHKQSPVSSLVVLQIQHTYKCKPCCSTDSAQLQNTHLLIDDLLVSQEW